MSELSFKAKKEWAKTLYTVERLSQKETAERVGVSAKTMSKWVNDSKWESLRVSVILTKEQQLNRLYAQMNELTSAIELKPEGKRYADKGQADTLVKLAASIRSLETEVGLSDIISVFKSFTTYLKNFDLKTAQMVVKLQDEYVSTRLK